MKRKFVAIILAAVIVLVAVGWSILLTSQAAFNDNRSVGSANGNLMHGLPYWSIAISVAYVPGTMPNSVALQDFKMFATNYTGKSVSITQTAFSGASTPFLSVSAAVNASEAARSVHSSIFGTISIWVFYVHGNIKPQPNAQVLAAAYDATAMLVFPDAMQNSTLIQAASLSHEFGHMLGLCGLTVPDTLNICNGSGHAIDPNSLMAAALNLSSPWVQKLALEPFEVQELYATR